MVLKDYSLDTFIKCFGRKRAQFHGKISHHTLQWYISQLTSKKCKEQYIAHFFGCFSMNKRMCLMLLQGATPFSVIMVFFLHFMFKCKNGRDSITCSYLS